jgi:hypothetical protein
MFDCVIALGASHIAGFGILNYVNDGLKYMQGKISLEDMDARTKPAAYPALVANHFDIPCYNYGLSGGSNDRSLRLLPQLLMQHKNSLVLFSWTSVDRSEFYIPEEGRFIGRDTDNYLQVGIQFSDWKKGEHPSVLKNDFDKMDTKINNFYLNNIVHIDHTNTRICNQIFYAEQVCKNFSKDFRHIYDCQIFENNSIPAIYENNLELAKVINFNLDNKQIVNLHKGSYENFCKSHFEEVYHGHYGATAHQAVSKLIIDAL